jgi:hypothetical protein
MGTNYYIQRGVCPHCDKPEFEFHIGKSSMGWAFTMHVYPDGDPSWKETQGNDPPKTWEEWKAELAKEGTRIVDEYRRALPLEEFRSIVEDRAEGWHCQLIRHEIDGRCVGYGEGTWDYVVGDFS